MSHQLPSSVQRFERVLFTGLHAVGLNPNDFHPRLIEQSDLDTISYRDLAEGTAYAA